MSRVPVAAGSGSNLVAPTHRVRWGLGETMALISACGYAAVNALLREVAVGLDPYIGALLRLLPLALIVWLLVALRPALLQPVRAFGMSTGSALLAAGVLSFTVGNVLLFRGFAWAGLGISAAALQGGAVLAGLVLSAALREPPTRAQIAGAAVVAAGLALTAVGRPAAVGDDSGLVIAGFFAALGAGSCYAVANTASRHAQRGRQAFIATLLLTNVGGVLSLLLVSLWRADGDLIGAVGNLTGREIWFLIGAGLANAVALGAVTLAVRYTTVASTATVTSSVVVISFVIGVLVFHEETTPALVTGVVAIVAGIAIAQAVRRTTPRTPTTT